MSAKKPENSSRSRLEQKPSRLGTEVPQVHRAELPAGYAELLEDLKMRIRTARIRAALSVNRELVLLYWEIGTRILAQQEKEGWGAKVIDRLAGI